MIKDTGEETILPGDEDDDDLDDLGMTIMSSGDDSDDSDDDLGQTMAPSSPRAGKEPPGNGNERHIGSTLISTPQPPVREPGPGDTVVIRPRDLGEAFGLIVVWSGPRTGDIFTLDKPKNIIGRNRDVQVFVDDEAASGQHASIRCEKADDEEGKFVLRDLDSENGTFVNGRRIDETTVLRDDDVVTVGQTDIVFKRIKGRRPNSDE